MSALLDYLRTIRDPEKPQTLEDLNVVYESGIFVQKPTPDNVFVVRIEFNPTVPHCSLATLYVSDDHKIDYAINNT